MMGIKPHLEPFIERMTAHREAVLDRMEKTVKYAQYGDVVRAFDVMTHHLQLLAGKPTHNIAITEERRAQLDTLIED